MTLEARLLELESQAAIRDLMTKYSTAVDTKDWSLFRSIFTEDATIDYTKAYGRRGGVEEIATWISSLMTDDFVPDTMHALSNITVTVADDTAAATAAYINPDVMSDGEGGYMLLLNGGRYTASCRNTADGWKIAEFVAVIMFSHRGALEAFEVPEDRA